MRIYLPATLPLLERWLAAGEVLVPGDGSADHAYAVTPRLRESYHDAELDELEHSAQVDASVASLRLLAADPSAVRRRVVLAVDVADEAVRPDSGRGRAVVRVTGSVAMSSWASALVDLEGSEAVVVVAVASVERAASGDDDAQFDLDEAEAHELGWYAVQELRYLFD